MLRNKEHLCLIKASENILVLHRLRFQEEIKDHKELDTSSSPPKPAELKMALSLIDQLTQPFDIKKYKDTYNSKLMKLIKARAAGKKTIPHPLKVVHSEKMDLMDQLKESLGNKKKKVS